MNGQQTTAAGQASRLESALTGSFDWEVHGPTSPPPSTSQHASPNAPEYEQAQSYKRRLGPTEVSYYLGSRGVGDCDGVNDMYLHVGFKAKAALCTPARLLAVWTELVRRHALLGARVEYSGEGTAKFVVSSSRSEHDHVKRSKDRMELRAGADSKAILDTYLNGPRTLSDDILSFLLVSTPSSTFQRGDDEQEYDFHLFSTHFLGDGMALHTTANEFFTLLSSSGDNIESFQRARQDQPPVDALDELALALESKLVTSEKWGPLAWAAAKVLHQDEESKLIGGHTFARPTTRLGPRRTVVPTISYTPSQTSQILATCKSHRQTISNVVFALCNFALMRSSKSEKMGELPCMVYSALNLRGVLRNEGDAYVLAIGYYNIILPTLLPKSISPSSTFWARVQSTREQTGKVVKNPLLAARSMLMALEREERAEGFERMDVEDERQRQIVEGLKGLGIEGGVGEDVQVKPVSVVVKKVEEKKVEEVKIAKVPSQALMGVSMLGNLDAMYAHKSYTDLTLHTLTTGSRQRPGSILLFAYTFAGRLWLSLGYDRNGFEEGVIERWWKELRGGVDEFLLV